MKGNGLLSAHGKYTAGWRDRVPRAVESLSHTCDSTQEPALHCVPSTSAPIALYSFLLAGASRCELLRGFCQESLVLNRRHRGATLPGWPEHNSDACSVCLYQPARTSCVKSQLFGYSYHLHIARQLVWVYTISCDSVDVQPCFTRVTCTCIYLQNYFQHLAVHVKCCILKIVHGTGLALVLYQQPVVI